MSPRNKHFAWGAIAACCLRLLGWLAVNALAAAGVMALVFFAIGSFSLPMTMSQLANLADRYVAADGMRRGQFDHIFSFGFFAALLVIAFLRRASFARAFSNRDDADA